MRIVLLSTLLVLLPLTHIHAVTADTSCGIIWDEPILLSDTIHDAYSPKIALSGGDTVHIVWFGGGIRLPYKRSEDGGQSFAGTAELLTDSTAFPFSANRPSVVAWHSRAYVFFQGGTSAIYSPIRMIKSTTGGATWQSPVNITSDSAGPTPQTPTILGDTVLMTYVPRGQVTHNILRTTDQGVFWTSVNAGLPNFCRLSIGSSRSGTLLHRTQIGVVGTTGEIEYLRSSNLGDSWVHQTFLTIPDGITSLDPDIAASTTPGDTSVVVAWRDPKYGTIGLSGCSIIARRGSVGADSTIWFPEQVLTSTPAGYEPAVDANERRFAGIWPMDQEESPRAEVRVSVDTSWCSAFDPASGIETVAAVIVDVAISSKAVHVVWEAKSAPPGTFRIFYRRGVFKTTDVNDYHRNLPGVTRLEQNYPNPFNPETSIRYSIESRGHVTLKVFDVLGREVAHLVDETKEPGEFVVRWVTSDLSSGVYFYRLSTSARIETRRAIIMK